jgi:hypothetical protein
MDDRRQKNRLVLPFLEEDKVLAAKTAGSAPGPWRLANSPALAFALPNAYFESLGIPRLTGCR